MPKKDNGMSCTANGECKTDACAKEGTATSGVCCDRACGGGANVCESCALSGKVGTCSFKSAGTVCGPGADVCTDNATTRSSATLRQQCSGTAATCGASGACPAGTKCNAAKTACATSCSAHSECWEGICDLWDIHNAQNKCASPADTCHVSPGGSGNGTFGSPFGIIQNCLAANKKYVRVSDGTYNESLSVKNKVALIAPQSPAEAMVTGSFTSNVIIQSPSASDALTVDGSKIAGSDKRALVYGMRFTSTSGSGSAIYVTQAARVDLLSVGAHDVAGTCIFSDASAALIVASSGTSRCGTGILKVGGSLDLRASYVFDHQTQGISVGNASLTMRSTIVGGNNVGVAISESTVDIDRVYVLQNNDRGIEIADSTAKVTNTVVASNGSWGIVVATVGGTAPGSSADFGNVTVAHNNGAAADVYCDPVSNVTGRFVNSIIWDDTGTGFSGCSFEYSTIKTDSSTPTGPGNNSLDPQFTFPSVLDYTLTSASPCVDTGSDTGGSIGTSVITATDVKGNNRKVKVGSTSSTIDRGAFERQTP
ncbi:MAG: hypothetical protein KC503_39645 [Myxococcales bacterium]|nr:hypothetical protein [Myxococcales bacterium]